MKFIKVVKSAIHPEALEEQMHLLKGFADQIDNKLSDDFRAQIDEFEHPEKQELFKKMFKKITLINEDLSDLLEELENNGL